MSCSSDHFYDLNKLDSFPYPEISFCDSSYLQRVSIYLKGTELSVKLDYPINTCDFYDIVAHVKTIISNNKVDIINIKGNGIFINRFFNNLDYGMLIKNINISLSEFLYKEKKIFELDIDFSKFNALKILKIGSKISELYNFRKFILPHSLEHLDLNDFFLYENHNFPIVNYKFKNLSLTWIRFVPKYIKNINVKNMYIGGRLSDDDYSLLINNESITNLFACGFPVEKPKDVCLKSKKEKVIFYENCKWFPTFQELQDAIKQGKYKKKCNFPILNDYVKYFTYKSDPP